MQIEEIREAYSGQYPLCEKLGKLYIPEENKIMDIPCGMWPCERCRPNLKYKLYEDILRNVYNFDLQKHFVITFAGKEYREKYSIEDSYKIMSIAWHKYLNVINYHYGKIIYILLPRAQKSGYCHYHILTNKFLDWKFLNKKRKKYGLGYVSIQKNKDVAEYLNTDFFKSHEWMIPKGIRHYRCSREIKLMNYKGDVENKYFTNKMSIENIKNWVMANEGIIPDIDGYYIQKLINQITDVQGTYRINNYKELTYEEQKKAIIEEIKEEGLQYKYMTKSGMFIKTIGYT